MTGLDLTQLAATLDPDGRGGRRHIDDVASVIRTLAPHIDPADIPAVVQDAVRDGERQGIWSAARTASVQRGRLRLPKSIALPRTASPPESLRPVDVPLRDELAVWAATLPVSKGQRQLLIAVNDWLRRTNGGDTPIVEAAERAYELVRDEKAFDSTPPRGGAKIWGPGRLNFQLLRCQRTATPLTWEPATTAVSQPGPLLCVENHATFRSLLRVLRAHRTPPWTAVAWIQGRNTAPLESLPGLPLIVTRLDYLGDLDPAGLAIAAEACAAVQRVGVPAGPADQLWTLLTAQPSRPGSIAAEATVRQLVDWLPTSIRERAYRLLVAGRSIPQEALRFDILHQALL